VITPNSYLPSLDITSIPSHFFENEDQDGVLDELSLRPSATSVNLPSGLSKLIAILLILGENSIDIGSAETVRAAAIDFRAGRRFEESNLPQIVGTVDEHPWTLAQAATAVEFAEYWRLRGSCHCWAISRKTSQPSGDTGLPTTE
jgi:hypothetical protein